MQTANGQETLSHSTESHAWMDQTQADLSLLRNTLQDLKDPIHNDDKNIPDLQSIDE